MIMDVEHVPKEKRCRYAGAEGNARVSGVRVVGAARLLGVLWLVAEASMGCGGASKALSARRVAAAALRAAAEGDAEALARWVDAEGRARLAAEGDRSPWLAQRAEQRARLAALRSAPEWVQLSWRPVGEPRRDAVLRRRAPEEPLRVLAALGPEGAAGTPRGALSAWARWLARWRQDEGAAWLSRAQRAAWRTRIDELLWELEDVDALRWHREGRRAWVVTATGRRIELVEEGAAWRVDRVGERP